MDLSSLPQTVFLCPFFVPNLSSSANYCSARASPTSPVERGQWLPDSESGFTGRNVICVTLYISNQLPNRALAHRILYAFRTECITLNGQGRPMENWPFAGRGTSQRNRALDTNVASDYGTGQHFGNSSELGFSSVRLSHAGRSA